jgi:hypothetical protein
MQYCWLLSITFYLYYIDQHKDFILMIYMILFRKLFLNKKPLIFYLINLDI